MISFDEFIKQDDEDKYNNMQMDIFEIQSLKDELNNRDMYISKLEVAFSKEIERLNKAIEEHKKGKEVVLLIPARTDTKYFKKLVDYGVDITFITGRLHFNNSDSAPFPSCYIRINGEKNLIPLHIKDYINKIITDKTIKLGDYIDETLEI